MRVRLLVAKLLIVALVGVATIAGAASGAPRGAAAATPKITNEGVGKVKLGKTWKSLNEKGLVGRQRKGCELAGPGTRAARLRAPLKGAVDLTKSEPRKVESIIVTDGAKAKGVGIGSTKPDIKAKFPHAKFDASTIEVFGITLVTVPKRDGGKFQFALEEDTDKVSLIGIPFIAFCE